MQSNFPYVRHVLAEYNLNAELNDLGEHVGDPIIKIRTAHSSFPYIGILQVTNEYIQNEAATILQTRVARAHNLITQHSALQMLYADLCVEAHTKILQVQSIIGAVTRICVTHPRGREK